VPGARFAVDRDGTLDDSADFDEEWLVELAIPLVAISPDTDGLATAKAARYNVPKNGARRCGEWNGVIQVVR
jgi:hypothetical protein